MTIRTTIRVGLHTTGGTTLYYRFHTTDMALILTDAEAQRTREYIRRRISTV
jgi:hypothetical protein